MNPEAQRIAIAEWCGWTTKTRRNPYEGKYCVFLKDGKPSSTNPPDYLNDLNAMHEAESRLKERMATDYVLRLEKLPSPFLVGINVSCVISWKLAHATAAQRAEALLRTIGKWQE